VTYPSSEMDMSLITIAMGRFLSVWLGGVVPFQLFQGAGYDVTRAERQHSNRAGQPSAGSPRGCAGLAGPLAF
jgi:hypothetical protein